jgi:hypothetical protein
VHGYGMIVGMNTGFHGAPVCRVRSARLSGGAGPYSRVARSRDNSLSYAMCQGLPNLGWFNSTFDCEPWRLQGAAHTSSTQD